MACQTGIRADEQILKVFSECKEGKLRFVKIVIRNERLCSNFEDKGSGDWKADWRRCLPDCIDAFEPCFLLFRLDSPSSWLVISFADDRAPVREKMLLAATFATFKAEFGQFYIRYEYHATTKNDVSLEAFERWLHSKEEPAPLSDLEKELDNAHHEQKYNHYSSSTQSIKGVEFPTDQDAQQALCDFVARKLNYVQLSVDTLNEAIKLEMTKDGVTPDRLHEVIPPDKPRYHFYRFSHTYNGEPYDSIVFIYSLPTSGCTIKERMLYSSCKSPFLQSATAVANFKPDKKIEMDSREKLSFDSLLDYVHPSLHVQEKGFAKPPGPARRNGHREAKVVQ